MSVPRTRGAEPFSDKERHAKINRSPHPRG